MATKLPIHVSQPGKRLIYNPNTPLYMEMQYVCIVSAHSYTISGMANSWQLPKIIPIPLSVA